jgi:hypothetical protein
MSIQNSFALNREANRIAQSDPILAAELRMRAYGQTMKATTSARGKKATAVKSVFALNSKANRVAQTKPRLAIQLRWQAAYA